MRRHSRDTGEGQGGVGGGQELHVAAGGASGAGRDSVRGAHAAQQHASISRVDATAAESRHRSALRLRCYRMAYKMAEVRARVYACVRVPPARMHI